MRKSKFTAVCLIAMTGTILWAAPSASLEMGTYKSSCASCHGTKAEGIVQNKSKDQIVVEKVKGIGTVTTNKANCYGPALDQLSEKEISEKLAAFRKTSDFGKYPVHSIMCEHLKVVENKEGKISDDKMAAYIHKTFGGK